MNLPTEIIQLIKDFCEYREAKIINDLGVGWPTKHMKWYEKWRQFVAKCAEEDTAKRTAPCSLYRGRCTVCGGWSESIELERKLDFDRAYKVSVFVELGWEPLERFVAEFGHLNDAPLYSGPLLKTCPAFYFKKPHFSYYQ